MWWLVKLALLAGVLYVGLLAFIALTQTSVIFPTRLTEAGALALPAQARRLELETADGERLAGVHLPPAIPGGAAPLVLGFGGNAWNADNVALFLHGLYPEADVVAFHYRGYRPSSGRPSARALLADAPLVHDAAVRELAPQIVVAAGFSIGAGVAAALARERPLAGLILVTPFDSMEALAAQHYRWAPVRLLLRHRIPAAELLRGLDVPTAVIAAEHDSIIPAARTDALRAAVGNLVLDRTIAGTDHNDLYEHAAFAEAMKEALARIVGPAPGQ